jgi:hypothetical protein
MLRLRMLSTGSSIHEILIFSRANFFFSEANGTFLIRDMPRGAGFGRASTQRTVYRLANDSHAFMRKKNLFSWVARVCGPKVFRELPCKNLHRLHFIVVIIIVRNVFDRKAFKDATL